MVDTFFRLDGRWMSEFDMLRSLKHSLTDLAYSNWKLMKQGIPSVFSPLKLKIHIYPPYLDVPTWQEYLVKVSLIGTHQPPELTLVRTCPRNLA